MQKPVTIKIAAVVMVLIGFTGCTEPKQQAAAVYEKGSPEHIRQVTLAIDDEVLANADARNGDWLSYGRNYREDRYSELDQINKDNLEQLGLAWTLDLGTKRGIQSTPLVVDGVMFFSGPWSKVYAVDARKGAVIWTYDPEVPRDIALKLCCGVVNRGLALYQGALFLGTLDGRLVSVDAADGSLNWEVMTIPENSYYSITGAPRIVNGNVLIGNGGAEFQARGYITAYDAETGEQVWRFYTVPGDPAQPFEHPDLEQAAKTWTGEWWKKGGGGTVWDSFVFDAELNTVYIGVGNGTPWNRLLRSPGGGDNLYLSSIVAVDADSGAYKWHYQTTPGDTWDYTATQPIILADIEIDGVARKVLMQAPKNGFFYVIDRVTGEFISAEAYTYVNWATGIDENGRPIEVPGARYEDGRTRWISPSSHGGHNWFPMSYNYQTGLVYIPGAEQAGPYVHTTNPSEAAFNLAGGSVSISAKLYNESIVDKHPDAPKPGQVYGRLIAYDPVKQQTVWVVPQTLHYNGGLLSTASGLLLQGDAEGQFSVRDAVNGEVLWQFDVRSGVVSSPVTYLVDGEQYISILVGWGGGQGLLRKAIDRIHPGTLYTFKLGGTAAPPKKLPPLKQPYTTLTTDATPEQIGHGYDLFMQLCGGCHHLGKGGGAAPDLTRSNEGIFAIYEQILLDGVFAPMGMPYFGDILNKRGVEDLKSFVLYSAKSFSEGMQHTDYMNSLRQMQQQYDNTLERNQ